MAKPRSGKFETATARLKHPVLKKPFVAVKLARGIHLLYRRNRGAGTWIVRAVDQYGKAWTRRIADADDFETANGDAILSFWDASKRALVIARGTGDETGATPVLTLDGALTAYEKHLAAMGGDPYNAKRPRLHLTDKLLRTPVALLGESGANELAAWRDGLLAKGLSRSNVKRLSICICAGLNLAASRDPGRIPHTSGWRLGLGGLSDTNRARRAVLSDEQVLALVAAAFMADHAFGLLVALIAGTGARLSQAARLRVADLEVSRCRLQMPSSRKGRRRKLVTYQPVPIAPTLTDMLARECKGRKSDDPLLRQNNGESWPYGRDPRHRDLLHEAVARAKLPSRVTLVWLRHAAIARSLLVGTPIAVVAKLSDTSVPIIERHYGKYILDASDEIARRGVLNMVPQLPAPMK